MHIAEHTPDTYIHSFHTHKELEIGLCLTGRGWFYFGKKVYAVNPGDVFVVNAGVEPHIAQSDSARPSRYLFLSFEATELSLEQQKLLLPFVYRSDRFQNRIEGELPAAIQVGALIRRAWDEYRLQDTAYTHLLNGILLQICSYLYRHYGSMHDDKDWNYTLKQYDYIQPALRYMKEHFLEPIQAKDVAHELSLSTSRTLHLLKEALGVGFKQYVIQLRLNEARKLLGTTDRTITEIALSSGFQSLASFYHSFHKGVGLSPQMYRKQISVGHVFHSADLEEVRG